MSIDKNMNQGPSLLEFREPCTVAAFAPITAVACALLVSCGQQVANAEQPPTVAKALELQPAASAPALKADVRMAEDAKLRRGYGVVDMRFNPCVTKKDDHTFVGGACPPGFVIYGPYVSVPANSEIDVSFEVRASKRIEIYSDIVSQMGAQMLAGLSRQVVEPGASHKLGYRLHVFRADSNVESRIGLTADPDTEFEVANLTMTVR